MLKLMEQIAFEITRKFNSSFTYRQLDDDIEMGFYVFSNEPREETFNLYITPDSIEVEVDLFRFDPYATTSYLELTGVKNVQRFLHEILYLLETSDTWEDYVKRIYCLNDYFEKNS